MPFSIALTAVIVVLVCVGVSAYYTFIKKDMRKSDVASLGWYLSAIVYFAFTSTPWWIRTVSITAFAALALISVLKLRRIR